MKNLKVFIFIFSLIVLLNACKKQETAVDTLAIDEIVLVEMVYADISEQIETSIYVVEDTLFSTNKGVGNKPKESCVTLSVSPFDSVSWPKNITVDFGNTNCMGYDGRNRRGKVLINTTGRYNDSATVLTVTFDNYYIRDNKISGTASITNQGVNNQGFPLYSIVVQNGNIETASGSIVWQLNRSKKWVNGLTTPAINDDAFIHAGNSQGTFSDGTAFNVEIINLLVTNTYCPWIDFGTIEISKQQKIIGTLDFGDFNCDSIASVVEDGVSYGVTLK